MPVSSAAPTGPSGSTLEGDPVSAVVILAAGEGKRMRSSRSKLLHEVDGRSLLSYAVDAATELQPEHVVVVVGHLRDQVEAAQLGTVRRWRNQRVGGRRLHPGGRRCGAE